MTAVDTLSDIRLYTPEETAELFPGVTAYWLNQQARKGRIPCTPLGRRRFFSAANIRTIIAGFSVEPTADAPRRLPRKNSAA
jgi:hypothetical protein